MGYTSVPLQTPVSAAHCTCLSLRRPLLKFHLLSPRTSPQPGVTPLSHRPILPRGGIFPPITLFRYYFIPPAFVPRAQNPSSGAYPNITMSHCAICVLTGSAGGTLWIAAKTIHSHGVPRTPMLFHSFILETRRNGLIHHRWNCCKYFLVRFFFFFFEEGSRCIIHGAT